MNFRTEIEPLPGLAGTISHNSRIWTIGSCFADNIGDRLLADGFDVEVNPLGTLYNPLSILRSLRHVTSDKVFEPSEFFEHEGKWRNYDFHSIFARRSPEESAEFVNSTLERLRKALPKLTTLMLTFGSARCFVLDSTDEVVANCHKQHPALFRTLDISLIDCKGAIRQCIETLKIFAPKLRDVVLTVSPIRHKAYGLHADRLSKSTLLLACDHVVKELAGDTVYFPSYEIMMDDLRDYRFYAADMVHPSEVAVDYIYDIFARTFFTADTIREASFHRRAFRRSLHRPMN